MIIKIPALLLSAENNILSQELDGIDEYSNIVFIEEQDKVFQWTIDGLSFSDIKVIRFIQRILLSISHLHVYIAGEMPGIILNIFNRMGSEIVYLK